MSGRSGFVPEPVDTPEFWARRLAAARRGEPANFHHAVFRCSDTDWAAIEAEHRRLLGLLINPSSSRILDVGCGWGRVLGLLPTHPGLAYVGIDVSPDMIAEAETRYWDDTRARFLVADARTITRDVLEVRDGYEFDWAVFVSVKHMIVRNLGLPVWQEMEAATRKLAKRLLFLEYDVNAGAVVL